MSLPLNTTLEKYQDTIYLGLFKVLNSCTGSLNNPCYNPPVSTYLKRTFETIWKDIANENGFDFSKDIKTKYINRSLDARLLNDNIVWFLILCSIYFNSKPTKDNMSKDIVFASSYLIYLKYYTSLSNKHFPKACDKTKAELALSMLSDKSLFSSRNVRVLQHSKTIINEYGLNSRIKNGIKSSTIALGMVYLFDVIKDTYYNRVKSLDDVKNMAKVIMAMRDRLSQSFKAYANQYYKIVENNITSDVEEESAILNDVNRIMSLSSQSMLYIPEDHFKIVSRLTEVPTQYVITMFDSAFKDINNTKSITPDIINIILTEKKSILDNENDINNWLKEVSNVIAIRHRYNIRDLILNIIRSNDEINNVFESKSLSFKHKMIQAQGLVIGLAIFDALKQYLLGSIKRVYVV